MRSISLNRLTSHHNQTPLNLFLRISAYTVLVALCLVQTANAQQRNPALNKFASDTLLVKFTPGAAASDQADAHRVANGLVDRVIPGLGVQVVKVPPNRLDQALSVYQNNPNIEFAERNYSRVIYLPATEEGAEPGLGITNNFNEQYNLDNIGQAFGATRDPLFGGVIYPTYSAEPDADINAPEGWSVSKGGNNVTIAILDTGVACNHLDLDGKCVEEISFVGTKTTTSDDLIGHGTHVAGIAAAQTDNNIGIAGVGWNSSIASLKVCWEDTSLAIFGIVTGQCDDADVATAIMHAISQGYDVINMSFAGTVPNATLEMAIDSAWNAGIVLVGAAGNVYTSEMMYPAAYANVIAVGSSDYKDNLSGFSSYGDWVSVLAPGSSIVSTVPGEFCNQDPNVQSDCYDTKSGTSMAAPQVAGLASLMKFHSPSSTNLELRNTIQSTAKASGALEQNMVAWTQYGRIDMAAALNGLSGNSGPTDALVQSILVSTVNQGRGFKRGQALVSLYDDFGAPIANATIQGSFSGSFIEPDVIADTNASGVATFETQGQQKGGVTITFCIDLVNALPLIYSAPTPPDCGSL